MSVVVSVDRSLIQFLLSDPNGPIGRQIRAFSFRVRNTARQICPVDTGVLRDSIEVTPGLMQARRRITYNVGTRVYYAGFVHNGTVKMPARPFLTQALAMERHP